MTARRAHTHAAACVFDPGANESTASTANIIIDAYLIKQFIGTSDARNSMKAKRETSNIRVQHNACVPATVHCGFRMRSQHHTAMAPTTLCRFSMHSASVFIFIKIYDIRLRTTCWLAGTQSSSYFVRVVSFVVCSRVIRRAAYRAHLWTGCCRCSQLGTLFAVTIVVVQLPQSILMHTV